VLAMRRVRHVALLVAHDRIAERAKQKLLRCSPD
jgi:hypothetical protein